MKKKTRMIALVLVLALSLAMLPQMALTAHAATLSGVCGAEGDNLTWTLDTELGVLTIEGSGKMESYFKSDAPWFSNRETIKTVILPEGLTSIGALAFDNCYNLTDVTIPDGVTVIETWAFSRCYELSSITLPNSVERICGNVFYETAYFENENNWDGRLLYLGQWLLAARSEILTADIREGTVGIADDAFCGCVSMRSVSIPDSVKMIGESAFQGCSSLEDVTLGNGVTEIGKDAFYECTSLEGLTLPDSLTFIGEAAFMNCSALQSIAIPGSVAEIDSYAFYECKALEELTISDGVTRIGYAAFCGCPKLASVEIPASVTEIGDDAFMCRDDNGNRIRIFTIYGDKGTAAEAYAKENWYDCCFVLRPENNHFADVKESDFFFTPVLWALGNDVTGGIDETHFAPERTVMRADAMVFFWAAKGRPDVGVVEDNPFKDVKEKHWYYKAVMWAVLYEITGGTDATHFSPKNTCTRSEILQFLYAAMGKPAYTIENPYSDVKTKHWYYDGAIWAYEKGLEKGENGKFQAKTPCTRGYVVTYLYRYMTGNELAQ